MTDAFNIAGHGDVLVELRVLAKVRTVHFKITLPDPDSIILESRTKVATYGP